MESLLCWYLIIIIMSAPLPTMLWQYDHYLAWYFSFMWLVWSRMLWLCRTPAPATALSRSPGGPPWCLQEPPACHQEMCNTIRTLTSAPVTWFLLAGEPLCGVLAPEPWPRWICCLATSCCWSASSRMKRLSKSVCVCWSGSSIPLLLTAPSLSLAPVTTLVSPL